MSRWLAAALLALVACGDPADAPPEIQYGLEECGFCRMIVSEEKFAAAAVEETGTASPFDDVGCLLNHLRGRSSAPKKVWVHDHASGAWIAAERAFFVRDSRVATPMGSGWLAFASREEAGAQEGQRVDVMEWSALLEPPAEK